MTTKTLVTYATRYGSTQEVAEKVAEVLRGEGLAVDVQAAKQVGALEGYDAVVMGAPLYIGHWLKDAKRFLEGHRQALIERPVAVFALGPTRAEEMAAPETVAQLTKELSNYPWLKPVDQALFGGAYDPDKLNFFDGLLAKLPASPLHGAPASDARDWAAIEAWASSLPGKLAKQ